MPDKCEDEELRSALAAAKKKPRNFALIAKGSTAVKLIVSKKPIKAGDVQKAKAEFKGNTVIEGVCQGEGTEMVFQVVGQEPSVKAQTIKELIGEQTGLTMKGRFQVVNELAAVDENDNESETAEAQPTDAAPPPPAPPPPPPMDDPVAKAIAQLTAAMNKLDPVIQAAAKNNPNRREEILKAVATFQEQIDAKAVDNAKATLLAVGKLAKDLASSAAAPAQSPAPVDKAAQWNTAWGAMEPKYLKALETASNDLAGKLRAIHAYATEQAEATQYDKALTALARLGPLIDLAGKTDAGEVSGDPDAFQSLFDQIHPRYLKILRENPDNAGELRATMDFANGKAEDGKYDAAITSLNKLSTMLDETEETLREEAIEAQIDDEDEGRGVIPFRKALLNWDAARSSAILEIRSLQATVAKKYPNADVDRLSEIWDVVDGSLHDALIDCINAEDEEDRKYYNVQALEAVRKFEDKIDSNDLIQGVDENPFDESLELGKKLKTALVQVSSFLK